MKKKNILIIIGIICLVLLPIIVFKLINDSKTNITQEEKAKQEAVASIKDDITADTPILEDFYNGILGMKSKINFTRNIGYFTAFKTEELTKSKMTIYVMGCFSYSSAPPEPTGFLKFDLDEVDTTQFLDIYSKITDDAKFVEGKYTFIIIPESYPVIGGIDLTVQKFGPPIYDLDKNGYSIDYLKIYVQDGELIDFNNPIYSKYNYRQLINVQNPKDKMDIIKIRVGINKLILTDTREGIINEYSTIEECNQYLSSVGFNNI